MWRQKIETEAKVMNVRNLGEHRWFVQCELVFCRYGDDLLLSEVQIYIIEQTKKYSGIILGSILPKNKMNY